MTMPIDEQRQFLAGLGLSADGATLAVDVDPDVSAKVAPPGVNPHTMPVSEIVFDPALLERFPVLEGAGLKAASDYVFSLYRALTASGAPVKDKERHSFLHRRISEFIGQAKISRATSGHVKELVKASKEQRELAALLAAKNLTAKDLIALLTTEAS